MLHEHDSSLLIKYGNQCWHNKTYSEKLVWLTSRLFSNVSAYSQIVMQTCARQVLLCLRDFLSASYQGRKKPRAGVEMINLASVQPDDISVAVISAVRMCECEIYEVARRVSRWLVTWDSSCYTKMHGISAMYVHTVAARSLLWFATR